MIYESTIKKLRKKWTVEEMFNKCFYVSDDLGRILQEQFPDSEVYTARSYNLNGGKVMIWSSHQVSVMRNNENGFVALDATRPLHEEGKEYWMIRANSKKGLLRRLSEHYTGDWKLNKIHDAHNSRYVELLK